MADALLAHLREARDELERMTSPRSERARTHVYRAIEERKTEAPTVPEIVPGDKLGDLPKGSLAVKCDTDGVPNPMYLPVKVGSNFDRRDGGPSERYRVLYRVPEEPIKVGDLLDIYQIERAPVGTIVRGRQNDLVAKRTEKRTWKIVGRIESNDTLNAVNEYVVLYVPEGGK